MLVGNDIVDLMDAETRPESLHPRFDSRVFTLREREFIAESEDAHKTRWLLWAAKESAYKAAFKLHPETIFSPVEFQVELDDNYGGTVNNQEHCFWVTGQAKGDLVHLITTTEQVQHPTIPPFGDEETSDLSAQSDNLLTKLMKRSTQVLEKCSVWRVDKAVSENTLLISGAQSIKSNNPDPDAPGKMVRKLVSNTLGALLSIIPTELDIIIQGRIPRIIRKNSPLPIDLSLSHHGRFIAFALSYCTSKSLAVTKHSQAISNCVSRGVRLTHKTFRKKEATPPPKKEER